MMRSLYTVRYEEMPADGEFTVLYEARTRDHAMTADPAVNKLTRTIASTQTLELAELPSSSILYTPLEERFERITRVAARVLKVPVAAISLFNRDEEWFKSVTGWQVSKLDAAQSLGMQMMSGSEMVIVPDLQADSRTVGHPLVVQSPHFRFFAGAPLVERHGATIGVFGVYDIRPRTMSIGDIQSIRDLSGMAGSAILADQIGNAQATLASKLGAARRESLIDPLTRVWNRRGANMALKSAFAEADTEDHPVCVGVMDVDRFKRINDTYGHDIGDIVLRKVAEGLVANMREDDIVCRLGGDEFLLLLIDADERFAGHAIERIREALGESPVRTRHGPIALTISVGYTVRRPGCKKSHEDVIQLADQALMASKTSGRNRAQIASDS
jgi:diguanylate cyclase (GGDEF)-like protein